jgi:hypothetical protein
MHLLSSILYTDNEISKLNVDAFITLNMNIDFNAIVLNLLVVDFPQLMMLMVYNAPQVSELDLILLWTALLLPGTRSVPTNFNQTTKPDSCPHFEAR